MASGCYAASCFVTRANSHGADENALPIKKKRKKKMKNSVALLQHLESKHTSVNANAFGLHRFSSLLEILATPTNHLTDATQAERKHGCKRRAANFKSIPHKYNACNYEEKGTRCPTDCALLHCCQDLHTFKAHILLRCFRDKDGK